MTNVVAEIRRGVNGWVIAVPGQEVALSDGAGRLNGVIGTAGEDYYFEWSESFNEVTRTGSVTLTITQGH